MDSKTASKKVNQSVQAETPPKKSGLMKKLCSCCTSSEKKQDRDVDKPSKSSKETVKLKRNKVQESIKRTRPATSTLNPEEIMERKTRNERSKNKRRDNSSKEEVEKMIIKDKGNIESKEKEYMENKEKEKKEKKRRKSKEIEGNEKKEKGRDIMEKKEDEQKETIEIGNKEKVENKEKIKSEAFSKSHHKDKKFASFASSSSAVEVLCFEQRELPSVKKCPRFEKETTPSPVEPPPKIFVQKYEELPSTSYKNCAPVDGIKQIQVNIDGPCSRYCAHYLGIDSTNKKWKKFIEQNSKTKIEDEFCNPIIRSKSTKPGKESHPPFKDTLKENWKKLQTKLPFLHKKSKKSSKDGYCRGYSGSEKKKSKCKVKYCLSEECREQQSSHKKNEKSKEKSKVEQVEEVKQTSKKDKACAAKLSLESISITVCATRRIGTKKFAENTSSEKSLR